MTDLQIDRDVTFKTTCEITHNITYCQFPRCQRLFASRICRVPADGVVPLCSTVIGSSAYSSICPACRDEHESLCANQGRRDPLPRMIVSVGRFRRLVATLAGIFRRIHDHRAPHRRRGP